MKLQDGRTLVWHHGSPQTGALLAPRQRLPHAELWLRPRDGHVSVLDALDWLRAW